jgi:hypothetical protein
LEVTVVWMGIAVAIIGVIAVGAVAVGSWLLFEPLRKTEEAHGLGVAVVGIGLAMVAVGAVFIWWEATNADEIDISTALFLGALGGLLVVSGVVLTVTGLSIHEPDEPERPKIL